MRTITTVKSVIAILLMAGLGACTKTEVKPLEEVAHNKMLTYKVVNGADTYLGAIDNVDNTITVYVPYYTGIEYLVPAITLEDGASLLDASGQKINLDNGIEPVPISAKNYTYTVSASNKVVRKYTLVTKIQPYGKALIAGFSFDWSTKQIDVKTAGAQVPGGKIEIFGNFESTSTNIKFTAKNRTTGKVYTDIFKVANVYANQEGYYSATADIAATADTGYYDIHMEQQGRAVDLPPLRLFYKKPYFGTLGSSAATLSPGDTMTLKVFSTGSTVVGYNGINVGLKRVYMKFNKKYLYDRPAGFPESMFNTPIELQIVKNTLLEVKVILPANIPVGSYSGSVSSGSSIENGYYANYGAIEFYYDYETWTGWGNNNLLGLGYVMYVLAPKGK